MLFSIVIASLLGVFLAPALANTNERHSENLYAPFTGSGLSTGSEDWKTVRDFETGYIATKVFSKDTCIIAKMDNRFFYDNPFPAPFGDEGPSPDQLPPIENRFIISRNRLQSLRPYGRRIQALCRGVPSYLAYPAAGSNFLMGDVSCFKVNINELPIYYCN